MKQIDTNGKRALRKVEKALMKNAKQKERFDQAFVVKMYRTEQAVEMYQRLHEHFLWIRSLHDQLGSTLDEICTALDELLVAAQNKHDRDQGRARPAPIPVKKGRTGSRVVH